MFENMATLTSSADFLKAVRDSDIEAAKKVLGINVRYKFETIIHFSKK